MKALSCGVTAIHSNPVLRAERAIDSVRRYTGATPRGAFVLTDLDCGKQEGLNDSEINQRYSEPRRAPFATPDPVRLPEGEYPGGVSTRVSRFS